MRKLRLVVLTRSGALPIVLAASVAPAVSSCGARSELPDPSTTAGTDSGVGGGGLGGKGGSGGAGGGSGGFSAFGGGINVGGAGNFGGSGGTGGQFECSPELEQSYEVKLPPEGVPAEPGQISSVTVEPVESGLAARVTLEKLGGTNDLQSASGFCAVDPDLEPRVVGLPVIEVIDATIPELSNLQVSNLQKQPGGWSFQASFPGPLFISPETFSNESVGRMTVRITLQLDCAPEPVTKVIHAATDIHVCIDGNQIAWVSSGDLCTVCRIIAEMAPSPIVPDATSDDLPLARALRLRLVELARISNTLVLFAEHDGGDGLDYEWHASAGKVERLAPDIVAWTLEEGMSAPFIQAAVSGPAALAVASYGFNEAA